MIFPLQKFDKGSVKIYIKEKLDKDPILRQELLEMKGKNLGCWCHPESCHGNVLLELIEIY